MAKRKSSPKRRSRQRFVKYHNKRKLVRLSAKEENLLYDQQMRQKGILPKVERVVVTYMDILAIRVGYKGYAHYLASDHWKNFRRSVRSQWCFCCLVHSVKLEVHHITYDRLGRERPTDVVTVCDKCHKEIHRMTKRGCNLDQAHISLYKLLRLRRLAKNP